LDLPDLSDRREAIADGLLTWFAAQARDLPWRRDRDPYRIWVSEVMLQQTRVETVIPYFERFVDRFPDVAALAAADLDDVLKAWEGLGYYRRARNIKQGAEQIVAAGGAALPADFDGVRALPGVGRYTAGAICSVAYGQAHPVVDGNVRRVLCRLGAVDADPRTAAVERWLWATAAALLPSDHAGPFNESLMELGATLCTPRKPTCAHCPVNGHCDGRDDPEAYPAAPPRKAIPHKDVTAGVIRRGERILITQRHAHSMLGGLWEFPGGKLEPGETLQQCLHREIDEELGITIRIERPFIQVDHAYSHFRITLHTFLCRHSRGRPRALDCAAFRWVHPDHLEDFAFPKADRVVLRALLGEVGR